MFWQIMTLMTALQRTDCAQETAEFRGRDEPVRLPTVPAANRHFLRPAKAAWDQSVCLWCALQACINLVPPETSDLSAETINRKMKKGDGKRTLMAKICTISRTEQSYIIVFSTFWERNQNGDSIVVSAQFQSTQLQDSTPDDSVST